MVERKRCEGCSSLYESGHWAFGRDRCPACGGLLVLRNMGDEENFNYEHYDSSTDIHFDLSGLLSPRQLRESRVLFVMGLVLLGLAAGGRVAWVVWDTGGGWQAPLWLDLLVGAMVLLSSGILVWSIRRLFRHRKSF